MRTSTKWMLPVTAFAMLLAIGVSTRAEDQAKEGKATISGTVTGEHGNPAADIEVRVMPPRPKKGEGPKEGRGEGHGDRPPKPEKQAADGDKPAGDRPRGEGPQGDRPPRPEPIAKAMTDAEGKYSIEVPAGKFEVVAGKRGMGMAHESVTVADGETKTIDLKLKKMAPGERRPGGPKPDKGGKAPE